MFLEIITHGNSDLVKATTVFDTFQRGKRKRKCQGIDPVTSRVQNQSASHFATEAVRDNWCGDKMNLPLRLELLCNNESRENQSNTMVSVLLAHYSSRFIILRTFSKRAVHWNDYFHVSCIVSLALQKPVFPKNSGGN